jgi:membrane protein implicated in regulation of membrane protease activity
MIPNGRKRTRREGALLLLLLPYVVLLWPGFYNFDQPELAGVPFFYWFQGAMVLVTAVITAVLYWLRADELLEKGGTL